jgi:hypothetical protein
MGFKANQGESRSIKPNQPFIFFKSVRDDTNLDSIHRQPQPNRAKSCLIVVNRVFRIKVRTRPSNARCSHQPSPGHPAFPFCAVGAFLRQISIFRNCVHLRLPPIIGSVVKKFVGISISRQSLLLIPSPRWGSFVRVFPVAGSRTRSEPAREDFRSLLAKTFGVRGLKIPPRAPQKQPV